MPYLKINKDKLTPKAAEELVNLCPFSAISYKNNVLDIDAACKMCKMCVRRGPKGVIEIVDDSFTGVDKSEWKGICVYADHEEGAVHPVTYELIGKAKELANKTSQEVYALLLGHNLDNQASELLKYGVDKVFVYDYPELKDFLIKPYSNAFEDFINHVKPSSILIGATNVGRSLAPRLAARFKTGLTADCTKLEIRDNTDLVQIRPAFGGNVMAQILTPRTRPQLCTVRYKIFSAPEKNTPHGEVVKMQIDIQKLQTTSKIVEIVKKLKETDISEADVIVAAGRGIKNKNDFHMIEELADLLGAKTACTRPLIEAGWLDAKHQIGLSGRTVKPKLIITAGISGSVQFNEGMKNSDLIISINSDPGAPIFNISHYGIVGDLYEVIPNLINKIKEEKARV